MYLGSAIRPVITALAPPIKLTTNPNIIFSKKTSVSIIQTANIKVLKNPMKNNGFKLNRGGCEFPQVIITGLACWCYLASVVGMIIPTMYGWMCIVVQWIGLWGKYFN